MNRRLAYLCAHILNAENRQKCAEDDYLLLANGRTGWRMNDSDKACYDDAKLRMSGTVSVAITQRGARTDRDEEHAGVQDVRPRIPNLGNFVHELDDGDGQQDCTSQQLEQLESDPPSDRHPACLRAGFPIVIVCDMHIIQELPA